MKPLGWVLAILIGMVFAAASSGLLGSLLESPEMKNYRAGRPLFDHPVSEGYAKIVIAEVNAQRERDAIIARDPSPWPVRLASNAIASLVDPIHDVFLIIFAALARAILLMSFARLRRASHPPATGAGV